MRFVSPRWLAAATCVFACGAQTPSPPARPAKAAVELPVKFPDPLPQVVLPMLDPLDEPAVAVEASLEGPTGKRKTTWMLLDTGASISLLPDSLLSALSLRFSGHGTVQTPGGSTMIPYANLPRLLLGGLTVEGLPVGGMPALLDVGVLGASVIERAPWEISWDRGTVTFNPTPWSEGGDVGSSILIPIEGRRYAIDVRLNGFPLRMMVDTGSTYSHLPRKAALRAGLPAISFGEGGYLAAGGELPSTGRILSADLEVGSRKLPGQMFVETDGDQPAVLGLPALTAYDLQIFPGRRLLFKPRNPDMRATATLRVGRWTWMPVCRFNGCVHAQVEGKGKRGRIIFDIEAALPRPVSILFGCAEPSEPDWLLPSQQRASREPPYRHVRLDIKGEREVVTQPVQEVDELLVGANGLPCGELTVLDVVPLAEIERPPEQARVSLLP